MVLSILHVNVRFHLEPEAFLTLLFCVVCTSQVHLCRGPDSIIVNDSIALFKLLLSCI